METKMTEKRGLSRDAIKYIAMVTMLLNHIGNIFLTEGTVLREVLVDSGYFTAITMCYFLVEGFQYTSSRRKYGERLLLFGFLSQIPYHLALQNPSMLMPGGFNMMFTLFLCFLILVVEERYPRGWRRTLLQTVLVLLSIFCDWMLFAPLFTVWFRRAGGDRRKVGQTYLWLSLVFAFFNYATYKGLYPTAQALLFSLGTALGPLASGIVIVFFYSGERSERWRDFSKWFFYLFYPVHLLILWIIRTVLR